MIQKIKDKRRQLDGILLLDKPKGLTSNQALQRVKRLYNADKAGHSGTLDPMATGMLPICFGEATKFAGILLDNSKQYQFTCKLGEKSNTGDAEGDIIATEAIPPNLTEERLTAIFSQFIGEIMQIPPMVSALHHQGKRLYELAREGIEVERKPRKITISKLTLDHLTPESFTATVTCSKGTYVRVLAEDIAKELGTLGHLTMLRRITIEPYGLEKLISLEELEALLEGENPYESLDALLLPADSAVTDLPSLIFTQEEARRILHGQRIRIEGKLDHNLYRLYSDDNQFLGIGAPNTPTSIGPKRIISQS
ncbi:tRNA pseudouridine(55) synthase TruB [Ignatzschineria cameli]|uniref:tRNA pseudouridine synthase B n=1 Tax=Ignatzschineria cameli TaxID=2182793 RepID=A0A2U2APS2_9GAMM|nr:tRNA pseudouridine(55) synthase TruB [Ignatzschineria cameli]PWD83392.1 tRNA pseudouridine(55) synthase TruB [Ignatzschineria cameli]PWD85510.1 tRNA pseudouridine(55) synthase TruB [Ignatzschineria cameli]PWD89176.1 tRNA pseudouridine(55) synthase TruB [Ignatzschineria cameli]PWD90650.1 tRNA pseudouridine(55) synthase TruB [Ignatzschineria cameli]PWD91354.1 tRNA pseudouridine(55) synthase TruB [Ignatzschineria cameli]